MDPASLILSATHIRLEPLALSHVDGLVLAANSAAAEDPSIYQWSPVPQTKPDATRYIETALAWKDAGTAVPFAILRAQEGAVIGSTRFWNIERWAWPKITRRSTTARLMPARSLHLVHTLSSAHRRQHRGQAPHARARF